MFKETQNREIIYLTESCELRKKMIKQMKRILPKKPIALFKNTEQEKNVKYSQDLQEI